MTHKHMWFHSRRLTKYSTIPLCPSDPVGGFPLVPNRSTFFIVVVQVDEVQRGVGAGRLACIAIEVQRGLIQTILVSIYRYMEYK